MRRLALVPLLMLTLPASARRKKAAPPAIEKVPSIEEVVTKEGFIPTLSQSDIYQPGVVLVPNAQGGHDKVFGDCVGVEPEVAIMSQSSIATSLSAGVTARLSTVRGEAAVGVEKRLSFVDPEQRTIQLADLRATEACAEGLENAARFTDLSHAILVYDVLVAQIQNTVCTKADASGSVMLLGEAEASAYSECVQESDAQVPLGYKALRLAELVEVGGEDRRHRAVDGSDPDTTATPPTAASGYLEPALPAGNTDAAVVADDELFEVALELGIDLPDRPRARKSRDELRRAIISQRALAARVAAIAEEVAIAGFEIPGHPLSDTAVRKLETRIAELRSEPVMTTLVRNGPSCGLDRRGVLSCWREASYVPRDAGSVPLRSAFRTWGGVCGLSDVGRIECWLDESEKAPEARLHPPESGRWIAFSAESFGGCAIREAGEAVCWGARHQNYTQYHLSNAPRANFREVISGPYHHCGIVDDGRTVCWGQNSGPSKTGPYEAPVTVGKLVYTQDIGWTCGLDGAGTAKCWQGPEKRDSFTSSMQYSDVVFGFQYDHPGPNLAYICGVHLDGTLGCEGLGATASIAAGRIAAPPKGRFAEIERESYDELCALDLMGHPTCWRAF